VIAVTGEREIAFITKEAFFDLHANKFPPSTEEDEGTRRSKGQVWFKHRHRREYIAPGVVFEPTAQPIKRPGALNLWRGFAVEPKQGNWSLMENHIRNILANGNETHAKYILNWMAYCVQHPEVQAEVALAFTGEQGSGKGVVWRSFGNLFAPHFRHFNDPDQFTGKFNANLGKSVFVLLDEAIWGGNKSVNGKVKAMITEPTLQIEPKGIDSMEVPNRLSIVACSNADWSVPVEVGDRRWAVFRTNDQYAYKECEAVERKTYFNALYAQMKADGQVAMLYDLLRRKVTADDIRNVPNTKEKARLKSLGLKPVEAWVEMLLQEGEIFYVLSTSTSTWREDGLVVDKRMFYESYLEFCKQHSKRPEPIHVWSKDLRKIFQKTVDTEYRETIGGKSGPRQFRFEPLAECRKLFDKHVGNEPGGKHWGPSPQAARERPGHLRVVQPEGELAEGAVGD
jgi:hypothetical protein